MNELFANTTHPSLEIRTLAESALKAAEQHDGFVSTLLTAIMAQTSQPMVIYLKNRVKKGWDPHDDQKHARIGPIDKEFLRQNILQTIVSLDVKLRNILAPCLHQILAVDYPEKWPSFLPYVKTIVASSDLNIADAGVSILWEVVCVYRFRAVEKHGPLHLIVSETFDSLLVIANNVLPSLEESAGRILHRILKTYYASIQYELCAIQQNPASLIPWGNLFMMVIDKNIPLENVPQEIDAREKCEWWKAKKWAYHCIYHLFAKFCIQPQNTKDSIYLPFSKYFATNFSPSILTAYLKQVNLVVNGTWMSNRCKQQISLFLSDSIKQKEMWAIIKPHLQPIVVQYIFPQLCITDEDLKQWHEDPVEYIQAKLDPIEDFRSGVAAAHGLLVALVKYRFKQTFMPIIEFVNSILDAYNKTPVEQRNPRQKDGAIHVVSCLASEILGKKSPIKDHAEQFLALNVLPEFKSQHAYLRVRACDVMMKFELAPSNLEGQLFKNHENIHFIFEALIQCLQDQDLPVRVWGALALREYLQYNQIREALKPHIPSIMQVMLNLTNEIDMDTISSVMETITATYPSQLAPYAVQLGAQLRDSFMRIVSEIDLDDDANLDEQCEKTMAAIGIMKTISTLVVSLDSSSTILLELEVVVIPMVVISLEKNMLDLYEDAFEIIDSFTFCMKAITPTMWAVLPLIYNTFKKDAVDYMEEMGPSLDNYLSYGRDLFVQNPDCQMMILDIVQTLFTNETGEADYVRACQLLESFMLNLHSHIDELIPRIIELALVRLNNFATFKTHSYKVHCLEIIINCIYYNPDITILELERHKATTIFINLWMGELKYFERVHDKKLSILSISKVLLHKDLPASLQSHGSQLFVGALALFAGYQEAVNERARVAKMHFEEDDSETGGDSQIAEDADSINDSDFEDDDTHDAFNNDDDAEYLSMLEQKANAAIHNESEKHSSDFNDFANNDDDDDDEWGVPGFEEDPFFLTVLDKLDPYLIFSGVLACMTMEKQQSLSALLSAEQNKILQEVMVEAGSRQSALPVI